MPTPTDCLTFGTHPSRTRLWLRAVVMLALVLLPGHARAQDTPVTTWTDQADALGNGDANWHSLAIMHIAMHDAINAATPTYARWAPPEPGEPEGTGADPQAALETAAATVLIALHPDRGTDLQRLLDDRLAGLPPGIARNRGRALGEAIGAAAIARRRDDGFDRVHLFPASDRPGVWRPTPPTYQASSTTPTRPFLFATPSEPVMQPPPPPGSPRYLADVEEVRDLGGTVPTARTPDQTAAALFWAYQSTQRGYVHVAATLVDSRQDRLSLPDQARIMAQVTTAMADSAIIVWAAKERWSYWRPVDAIRSGQFGVPPDPTWSSFIETPEHPEYPAGHTADCYTGAGLIAALLLQDRQMLYVAQSALPTSTRPAPLWSSDMGLPPVPVGLMPASRHFATVEQATTECASSRIWAGAHFSSANEESRRIAAQIVARARAAVPKLP